MNYNKMFTRDALLNTENTVLQLLLYILKTLLFPVEVRRYEKKVLEIISKESFSSTGET